MGAFSFSLDTRLVVALQAALPLRTLVETGTYEGDTVAAGLPYFDDIFTVELSEPLWVKATQRFSDTKNVRVLQGSSPAIVAELAASLSEKPVLYWLDAHWCVGTDTSGEMSQCPLLEEVAAIGKLNDQSVVLIDDARLFTSTPPAPHEVTHWPQFNDLVLALQKLNPTHRLMIVNDVIAFYPPSAEAALSQYARNHGVDILLVLHERKEFERVLREKEAYIREFSSDLLKTVTRKATSSGFSRMKDIVAKYRRAK